MDKKLKALLEDYQNLPEYSDRVIINVNQISAFGDYPIHIAAVRGNLAEVELLYRNGADINICGEYGYTPLLHAVEQGHLEVVEWLIQEGVDTQYKNIDGDKALDIAKRFKYQEIGGLLEKHTK